MNNVRCIWMLIFCLLEIACAEPAMEESVGQFSGVIVDGSNRGIVAHIGLFRSWDNDDGDDPIQITTTDAYGRFQFNGITAGVYQLVARSEVAGACYVPVDNVCVRPGMTGMTIRLPSTELTAYDLHGELIEEDMTAHISNAQVRISFASPVFVSDVTTFLKKHQILSNNTFQIPHIYPGKYSLTFSMDNVAEGSCVFDIKPDGSIVFGSPIFEQNEKSRCDEGIVARVLLNTEAGTFEKQIWISER